MRFSTSWSRGGVSQHLVSGCHIALEVATAPRWAEKRHKPRRRGRKWPVVVKSWRSWVWLVERKENWERRQRSSTAWKQQRGWKLAVLCLHVDRTRSCWFTWWKERYSWNIRKSLLNVHMEEHWVEYLEGDVESPSLLRQASVRGDSRTVSLALGQVDFPHFLYFHGLALLFSCNAMPGSMAGSSSSFPYYWIFGRKLFPLPAVCPFDCPLWSEAAGISWEDGSLLPPLPGGVPEGRPGQLMCHISILHKKRIPYGVASAWFPLWRRAVETSLEQILELYPDEE